jgi:hypothetical protein
MPAAAADGVRVPMPTLGETLGLAEHAHAGQLD